MNNLKVNPEERNWHQIISWWEIRRFGYNLIMILAGILSFSIAAISIPLIYLIIGLGLNLIYTLGWIIELLIIKTLRNENIKSKYPMYFFIFYLIISISLVFGYAINIRLQIY